MSVPQFEDAKRSVGRNLRSIRLEHQLSAREVARRTGMSHSKISRLENGRFLPAERDVKAIATALRLNRQKTADLVKQVRDLTTGWTDYQETKRLETAGFVSRTKETETVGTLFDVYEGSAVPAQLQTGGYVAALLVRMPWWQKAMNVDQAIANRLHRQSLMFDSSRKYRFLMREAGLRAPVAASSVMTAQMEAIIQWTQRPNVDIGLLPIDVETDQHLSAGFRIIDRVLVEHELYGRYVSLSTSDAVLPVLDAFEAAWSNARVNADAADSVADIRNTFVELEVDVREVANVRRR